MVVILRNAAASLVVGVSLLSGTALAQWPCLSAATAPVRNFFQESRYGAGEMQRAADEVRLNQRRVELERRATQLAREYAEYNSDVGAFLHFNFAREPNTSLYLPQPTWASDPTSTGWRPSDPWPSSSVQAKPQQLPASQPGYNPPCCNSPSTRQFLHRYYRNRTEPTHRRRANRPSCGTTATLATFLRTRLPDPSISSVMRRAKATKR